MWGGNEAITNEEANEVDEQWKPMRQSLPPLKTEQSKKEGVPNHGLSQVWTSFHYTIPWFHPHHPWHGQWLNYGVSSSIHFVHCIILSTHQ